MKLTAMFLAAAAARELSFADGPNAHNDLGTSHCSKSWYGTLEQAKTECAKRFDCEWLHDWGCDNRNWRFCGGARDNAKGDMRACTKVVTERNLVFIEGPKVANDLAHTQCHDTNFYGTLAEAQRRCALDQSCEWLHDHTCDGKNWRFCGTQGTTSEPSKFMPAGDQKACTMLVEKEESVDVEMTIDETKESFTNDKKTTLREEIAKELGLSVDDVEITVGAKVNKVSRRLIGAKTGILITVTIKVQPSVAAAEVEKLASPAFATKIAAATGITTTFKAFKPAHGSSICATCQWDGTKIHVTHYINAQKHGEKGLQHKCYHTGGKDGKCKCECM